MWAKIIFYSLEGLTSSKKEKVLRILWGKEQQSYYGKYKHRIGGIVDNIPYMKPARSTLIVKLSDAEKIINYFKENRVKYNEYKISVPKKELDPKIIY